jgi:hypothetical protein
MKEKDLIKLYFENYYPNNKKYVYKEDFGIGSVIFLFILFLMIKTFSKSNSNEISKKIDNNPSIPVKIIKNLENIKDILIKDNPNKDLKEILILIEKLDDNLNLLSSTSNRNKVIQDITDQIIRFLELVTEMYFNQTPDKKDRLFNELNKILSIFGLSEMFKKLLEVANNKGEIKADTGEVVSLSQDDLKNLVLEDDEIEEEQNEDDEDDVINFDEIGLEDEEDEEEQEEDDETVRIKKILENKDIDEIKKFITDKKDFINTSSYVDIKESFEYIINNFKEYSNEELKQLYIILYDNDKINDFSEAFGDSDIYQKTADKIEQIKDLQATLTDYDKLLNYLKTKNIYIEEYKHNRQFIIKINLEQYKFGKIIPLKSSDLSKSYFLMFHEENNKFDIYTDPQDIDNYRLYDTFFRFLFENINILNLKKACEGNWKFTSEDQKINFSVTKYYPGFEKTNIESVIINSKTFISKQFRTAIKEQKPTNPLEDNLYYYCIKVDDSNLFVTEIKGDFLRFLKELFAKKFFKYKTYNNQVKIYNFTDNQNLSDLISIDCNTDKNHQFLQKISSGNSKISFDDQLFKKVNPYFISQERGFIIIKTTGNWFQN